MTPDETYHWAIATTTRLAARMRFADRDNAIGDALLAFVQRILPAYDPTRPFEPYARAAIRRHLISTYRHERTLPRMNPDALATYPAPTPRADNIANLVAALPKRRANILLAFYRDNRTVAELAARYHTTPGAIRVELHRARKALAERALPPDAAKRLA